MRTAALTFCFFVACGVTAIAQRFTLLPQVGFENSKTKIKYNEQAVFSPLGIKFSPQASLRLNYTSGKGHGFFAGLATSRSIVAFSFSDPETGVDNYRAVTGDMQLRLEGGYLYSTKPIYFDNSTRGSTQDETSYSVTRRNDASYSNGSCSKSTYTKGSKCAGKEKPNITGRACPWNSWMRIQPSVGMAFIPAIGTDIVDKSQAGQTLYEYRAGNWQTALIAGVGFEFGRGKSRLFSVSIQYFEGIGNLNVKTFTSYTGNKAVTTNLQSETSGWSLKAGILFTLSKAQNNATKKIEKRKSNCQPYRIQYRCRSTM